MKTRLLLLAPFALAFLAGCNATNDNPIDADKMQSIRNQEASQRQNFRPPITKPSQDTGAPK